MTNKDFIEVEDWRKAEGVISEGANSYSAPRNYGVECRRQTLDVIKGYRIYWCSAHHQPLSMCEFGILRQEKQMLEKEIESLEGQLEDVFNFK